QGKVVLRKKLYRADMLAFFAQLPPCMIAMESCSGSHYWGRELRSLGHDVRLISPKFVVAYRKNQKNDYNDAEAICEAVSREHMRFVAIKSEEQQTALMVHRIREQCIAERTSISNQIRGHLHEFGIVVPQSVAKIIALLPGLLDEKLLPALVKSLLRDLLDAIHQLNERIGKLENQIQEFVKTNDTASRLLTIKGIGPISASAIVATVGDARLFKNSRQFTAWLGLVPKQISSGGKTKLGGITKCGDGYIRKLLIQGSRAVLYKAATQDDSRLRWINQLRLRKPDNVVATALAAKLARTVWAVMVSGETYQSSYDLRTAA
ncbi:MAG TPA: IS110 family transposase, partial [Blastocatellia bacterium]|nr:IS110 family transposase [Blastocatellia bacterium]